jgi:type VI protein secretion system component Hcp
MAQSSDKKPAEQPKPASKTNQPTLTELSPEQLGQVAGGLKVQTSEITFTHKLDKSTP